MSRPFLLFLALCVYRLLNALLIQTQFDPDEYWQGLEPAYCQVFKDKKCAYTWEWTRRAPPDSSLVEEWLQGPIRSFVPLVPTYWLYSFLKNFGCDTNFLVSKGPILLHAIWVTAPTDLAVWVMSGNMGKDRKVQLQWWALACSVTSWFHGYALIRTYSNSVETMLLSVGMALLSLELFGSRECSENCPWRHVFAFVLGGFSVAIRFSSLAAWVPIGIILSLQKSTFGHTVRYLIYPCFILGLIGLILTCVIDRFFYGVWVVPVIGNFHFNVILGHGSLYGTHPPHWYFSSGTPAITGVLLVFVLASFFRLARGQGTTAERNIWIVVGLYTFTLSFSPHKEFRFLLPILPLYCLLAGKVICLSVTEVARRSTRWLFVPNKASAVLAALVLLNFPHLVYLATVHQRAPLDVNAYIGNLIQSRHGAANAAPVVVHYLTGCHSTPLYSYLHTPNVTVDAWHLDCSPECRADPNNICESDRMLLAPSEFISNTYGVGGDSNTCHPVPDFLVMFSEEAKKVTRQPLEDLGMIEIKRFPHAVSGFRIGAFRIGDTAQGCISSAVAYDICFEEMLLFGRQDLRSDYKFTIK